MTMDNDDVIDTLNDLLESCRDGEYGFSTSAEHTKSADLKTMWLGHAEECRTAGQELQTLIRQLGGEPDEGGTVSGALHRGWVAVRGTLSTYSDQAMLDECERGEDAAVARYRKALKEDLPPAIRGVVERQAQGAQRNHDQVKAMRDSLKATH
ncbi:MAG: PA2169 family four-helix-bundle protein [Polaromonas sp.]